MWILIPLIFWGVSLCVGFLIGGGTLGVIWLLCALGLTASAFIFGLGITFLAGIALLIGFLAGSIKLALIFLGVVFAAWIFLKSLG